jgi:hypothetical protein
MKSQQIKMTISVKDGDEVAELIKAMNSYIHILQSQRLSLLEYAIPRIQEIHGASYLNPLRDELVKSKERVDKALKALEIDLE